MRQLNNKGFTMIEIMLVVIIIGILAAMVLPNFSGRGEQARISAARADIDANLSSALDLFELDAGKYPTSEQGLIALVENPASGEEHKWKGPYLKKKSIPVDPWGRAYVYNSPGTHNTEEYDLYSLGKDGVESEDDITNWVDK